MGRITIPVTALSRSGNALGSGTASDSSRKHALAANAGKTILVIVSTDAGAQTVTVEVAPTIDDQAVTAKTISVAAGATVVTAPFPPGIYNQPSATAADATLTSDATAPSSGDTVTIDGTVYTFRTALTEAKAAATLTSDGTAPADGDTVTVDTVVYTFRTTLTGAAATATLTSTGTSPSAGDTVTLNDRTYSFKASASATLTSTGTAPSSGDTVTLDTHTYTFRPAASATLTSTGTSPADGDTVTIDTRTYTFKTTLTGAANEVLIGANAAAALTNLKAAVNGAAGAGSTYGTGTTAHATVTAGALTATTLVFTAKSLGTAANSYASTETSAQLSFGGATFAGGVSASADDVLIGAGADEALTNLKAAVNGAAGSGTLYGSGTTAHSTVTAGTLTATTLVFVAKTLGTGPNSYASTEASSQLSFGGATFAGGTTAIPNDVLIGATAAEALSNLKSAVNGSAGSGSLYGSGTSTHATVTAGTLTSTTLVFTANASGTGGNSYPSTETSSTLSFGAATFAGGVDTVANEVLIGGSAANALSNLKAAINDTGTEGTNYSTGTAAHTTVAGGTLTSTTLVLNAIAVGTAANAYVTQETSTHLAFGGATMSGGVDAVVREVLIGGSAANALANLKKAIDDSGTEGTDYSTGTTAHGSVAGGTLTSTTLQVTAINTGAAGSAITTSEASSHLSWTGSTLSGGYDAGCVLIDPSVSTTLTLYAFST